MQTDMEDKIRDTLSGAVVLLASQSNWTRGALARDSEGFTVSPHDPRARSFCLVGAIAHLSCMAAGDPLHNHHNHHPPSGTALGLEVKAIEVLLRELSDLVREGVFPPALNRGGLSGLNDDFGHDAVLKLLHAGIAHLGGEIGLETT